MRIARLLLLCLPLLACVAPRSAIRPEERGPVLFTVTHPDKPGARLSLLGTIHIAPIGFRVDRAVERTLDEAEQLFVEVDTTPELEQRLQGETLRLGLLPEGQSVKDQLSPETWTAFEAACKRLQLNPAALTRFRPWFLGLTLTILTMQRANPNLRPELGLDKRAMAVVRAKHKPITQLESAEFQLGLLSGGDDTLQQQRLSTALQAVSKPELSQRLFTAFEAGDLGTLEQMMLEQNDKSALHEEYVKRFWTDRNVAMFEKLKAAFGSTTPQVVAVGAGHLIGDTGLVRQFERAGYVVERVKSEGLAAPATVPWVTEPLPGASVSFPGKPTHKTTPLGDDGESTVWMWQGGTKAFVVEVMRSPKFGKTGDAARVGLMEATVEQLAKGRTRTKSERGQLAGRPALHAVIDGGEPSLRLETWIIDSADTLYSLRVVWAGEPDGIPQAEFDQFFQSLKLE